MTHYPDLSETGLEKGAPGNIRDRYGLVRGLRWSEMNEVLFSYFHHGKSRLVL